MLGKNTTFDFKAPAVGSQHIKFTLKATEFLAMRHFFEVLDIAPGANYKQVRQAYRDAMRVWHPDYFQSQPELLSRAEERTKEIVFAYHYLTRNWAEVCDRLRAEEALNSQRGLLKVEVEATNADQIQHPAGQGFRHNRCQMPMQERSSFGRWEKLEAARSVFLVLIMVCAVMSPNELWQWVFGLVGAR